MNKLLFWLEAKLGAGLLRLLRLTLRIRIIDKNPPDQLCIYAFWHRNLLPLVLHRFGDPIAVVISSSKDGELIAGPARELGVIPVRGSTTRNGSEAMKEMLRLAKTNQLGITPDGPKGPAKTIQPGVLYIAYLAKIPIIPLVAECEREWVFNSWDRFRFPKPFSRVLVKYGAPIWLRDKDGFPKAEAELRAAMDSLEAELSAMLNQPGA